ncbi:DDE domain-containing protein [Roseomonas sp. M0104]|uniref:DDE domain-containing protein n=1 Tax=Teichococcus coralli TaxID=2545983 RepID=A0A845BC94_9PROT|nr:DDE domain-containing protein [Pseudoroseomonas coralli]
MLPASGDRPEWRSGRHHAERASRHGGGQGFFRSARLVTGLVPDKVTTDGHGSYPRAIRSTLGKGVTHRTGVYKDKGLEQDHRGIKGRIRCRRGFKSFVSAERFSRRYDELRNHFRPRRSGGRQHQPACDCTSGARADRSQKLLTKFRTEKGEHFCSPSMCLPINNGCEAQ